jgi:hypothetical protein
MDLTHAESMLAEHAYLTARGVRALALVGHCAANPETMLRTLTRLQVCAEPGAIPFVCDRGDGIADYGYGAAPWAIDLYRWATSETDDPVPALHRHRIVGLLLGYSRQAITDFESQSSGRLFAPPATTSSSAGREPTSPHSPILLAERAAASPGAGGTPSEEPDGELRERQATAFTVPHEQASALYAPTPPVPADVPLWICPACGTGCGAAIHYCDGPDTPHEPVFLAKLYAHALAALATLAARPQGEARS